MENGNVTVENQYPGEESITTDDLIFSIGEKDVDLQRKKRAINNLVNKLQNSYKQISDLTEKIRLKEDEIKNKGLDISQEKDKINKEILQLKESFEQEKQKLKESFEQEKEEIKNSNNFNREQLKESFEQEKQQLKWDFEQSIENLTKKVEKQRILISELRKETDIIKAQD